jgi:chromosome partitioning protein
VIDCPPSFGLLTGNALAAADRVLIPLQADYLALKGVDHLMRAIDRVCIESNPHLSILGLLFTMADARLLHTQEIIRAARESLGGRAPAFRAVVRMSVRLKEAPVAGQSILQYAPQSSAAAAYRDLAAEVEERL